MAIDSICNKKVITTEGKSTLKDVSNLMQKEHVGCVVVTEAYNGKKIASGIITDRDIALAVGASKNPQDLTVDQIMRSRPITAKSNEGIYEVAMKMKQHGIKRMPVTDSDGSLCGLVSADDIYRLMGEELNNLSQITEVQIDREKGIRMPEKRQVQL